MKPRLFTVGAPPQLALAHPDLFQVEPVGELPLDFDVPALGYSGGQLLVLPGNGAEPWGLHELRPDRVSLHSLLARACGITRARKPEILDAMAGWGTDAATLRALGCTVQSCEQEPMVWALLLERDGSARCADGFDVMRERSWPVIYLDPMFEPRGRKGLAKRPLQVLQQLAAPTERPLQDWLAVARQQASDRVVLKCRAKAQPLATPDWQIKGRSIRFDVYRPAAPPAETRSE